MMKGIGIAMLLMLLMSIGCATPYARQWQPQLWQDQEQSTETPKIGRLKTIDLDFDILVTRFWDPNVSLAESIIGVTISSRNQT
ncbi:hypothetical protein HYR99_22140, partial [Candidatus Poribacteria bacterium]|nr:hypothetical protein [Candidatus Poribacteria bacterium]